SAADAAIAATTADYSLAVDVLPNAGATGNNGVGLVFGFEDTLNYYRVRWADYSDNYAAAATHKDLLLEHVTNGVVTVLASADHVDLAAAGAAASFRLEVDAHASDGLHVLVNGV